MRIVQIVENLETGGLERLAVNLALEYRHHGHEAVLYCAFQKGELAAEAEAAGILVRVYGKRPGFSPALILRMARDLRRDKADVVHTHNPGIHHYGALAAAAVRVPVVVNTRHGPATSYGNPYQERYFRAVIPLTGAVVCVSEQSRRYLIEQRGLSRSKSRVILNGVPVAQFQGVRTAPGGDRPRIRFGSVGRMVPVKAHQTLIDAFGLVAQELPGSELRITGGGVLLDDLKAQVARLGLGARVRIDGVIHDTPSLYREMDIFVLSSISEGLPVVILEAMAAGLPIVSTRVGGVPEVAPEGDVAWYCEPGSAEALAAVMRSAAHSDELAARGQRGRELVAARYSMEKMYRDYLDLYEQLRRGRS